MHMYEYGARRVGISQWLYGCEMQMRHRHYKRTTWVEMEERRLISSACSAVGTAR